jgi:hypothetical protein
VRDTFVTGEKCASGGSHIAALCCSLGSGAECTALNIEGVREHS